MEAERRKRATVLESEGTRESAINVAEGQKQAQILASEGERAERINKAAGKEERLERRRAKADLACQSWPWSQRDEESPEAAQVLSSCSL